METKGQVQENNTKDGRGALLWEEPEEDVNRNRRITTVGIFIMLGILSPLVIWLIFINLLLGSTFFLIGGIIGIAAIVWGRHLLPRRIYENGMEWGIDFPALISGSIMFYSWGQFISLDESDTTFTFFMMGNKRITLGKGKPGLTEVVEKIRDKVGKPEYYIRIYLERKAELSKKLEPIIYIGGLILSLFVSFFMVFNAFWYEPLEVMFAEALGIWFPLFFIYMLGLSMIILVLNREDERINIKVNLKVLITVFLVLNLLYLTALSSGIRVYNVQGALIYRDFRKEAVPIDEYSINNGSMEGEFYINQSLYVPDGMELSIVNSSLVFGDVEDIGIYVARNARLSIDNSTFQSLNPNHGYWFEVYGQLIINNSIIRHVWGDREYPSFDGGIELYGASAIFENTLIEQCKTNGVLASDSHLTMRSCVITNCPGEAIELHETSAIIDNCSFKQNGWTVTCWDKSDADFVNCTFKDNWGGLHVWLSSPSIINCTFRGTKNGAAIDIIDHISQTSLEGNIFEDNDENIERPSEYPVSVCMILLPVGSIIFIIIIYSRNKVIMKMTKGINLM